MRDKTVPETEEMAARQHWLKQKLEADAFDVDLHGYHPDDIDLSKIIEQAWELGVKRLRLIHGHGRNRGLSPGCVNTNTGYFGLRVRDELRHSEELRRWIKHTTLDCSHEGSTCIKLKPNPKPTRTHFDASAFPERSFGRNGCNSRRFQVSAPHH